MLRTTKHPAIPEDETRASVVLAEKPGGFSRSETGFLGPQERSGQRGPLSRHLQEDKPLPALQPDLPLQATAARGSPQDLLPAHPSPSTPIAHQQR